MPRKLQLDLEAPPPDPALPEILGKSIQNTPTHLFKNFANDVHVNECSHEQNFVNLSLEILQNGFCPCGILLNLRLQPIDRRKFRFRPEKLNKPDFKL